MTWDKVPAHGKEFATNYFELVDKFMGSAASMKLQCAYDLYDIVRLTVAEWEWK